MMVQADARQLPIAANTVRLRYLGEQAKRRTSNVQVEMWV